MYADKITKTRSDVYKDKITKDKNMDPFNKNKDDDMNIKEEFDSANEFNKATASSACHRSSRCTAKL